MNEPNPNQLPVTIERCLLSRTAATFDPNITFEHWLEIGTKLASVSGSVRWWSGDWARFGAERFGRRAVEACRESNILGYDPNQLMLAGFVAQSVEPELRTEKLSHEHHAEVAEMSKRDQAKWLDLAVKGNWSVAELRRQIRLAQGQDNAHVADGPILKTVSNKLDDVASFVLHRPSDWWDAEKKTIWRERLRPLVEFYQNQLN
jgi:hypothetical protein